MRTWFKRHPVASDVGCSPPAQPKFQLAPGVWLRWMLVLVFIKGMWLAVDHAPMLFLGDSDSYLATAWLGWIPPDRSFLYGMLLQPLAFHFGSLWPLLVAQTACSLVAAVLLARIQMEHLHVPPRTALWVAAAWAAAEPLALLYERYLMTEAFALLGLAWFVYAALACLARQRALTLVGVQVAALWVLALRSVFIPVSLVFAVLLPVMVGWRRHGASLGMSALRHMVGGLVVSVGAAMLLHGAYKQVNGWLSNNTPAYQYRDGLFLLAAWAPVVRAEDFPDPQLGRQVLARSACPQADLLAREAQRWVPGCVVDLLIQAAGNEDQANAWAAHTARRALRRNPLGVVRLAWSHWLGHFDRAQVRNGLHWDRGERGYSASTVGLLQQRLGVADAGSLHARATATNRWYFAVAAPWVMCLALAPLVAVVAMLVGPRNTRWPLGLIAGLAGCLIGAIAFGSTTVVPRYLHGVAWLLMMPLGVLVHRASGCLRRI